MFSSDNSSDNSQILVLIPCVNTQKIYWLPKRYLGGGAYVASTCISTNQLCAFISAVWVSKCDWQQQLSTDSAYNS